MITFKTPTDKECFIDSSEVIAVIPCSWGLFQGSAILLKGGVSVAVCGEPGKVMKKLKIGLKQVGWYQSDTDTFCHLNYSNKGHYPTPLYIKG